MRSVVHRGPSHMNLSILSAVGLAAVADAGDLDSVLVFVIERTPGGRHSGDESR